VIALLMLATVLARLPMSLAIAFHEGSTMVVLVNSMRLLRFSAEAD
jgi:Zn2+/Cd2+-exporting ATPase